MADSLNEETGELNLIYTGNNPYEEDNIFQNEADYDGYRSEMDTAWENYVRGGGDLTRQEWFEDVKPVWNGENVTFNGEAQNRGDEVAGDTTSNGIFVRPDPAQKEENLNTFNNLINSGSPVTNDDVVNSIVSVTDFPTTGKDIDAWVDEGRIGPGGWINVNGTALKTIRAESHSGNNADDFSTFELAGGSKVTFVHEGLMAGKWIIANTNNKGKILGQRVTIPDPSTLSSTDLDLLNQWIETVFNAAETEGTAEAFARINGEDSFENWLARQKEGE